MMESLTDSDDRRRSAVSHAQPHATVLGFLAVIVCLVSMRATSCAAPAQTSAPKNNSKSPSSMLKGPQAASYNADIFVKGTTASAANDSFVNPQRADDVVYIGSVQAVFRTAFMNSDQVHKIHRFLEQVV